MRYNRDEHLASILFSSQGYTVLAEPNGNTPPDLLLNGEIAVEVTRLNTITNISGIEKPISDSGSSIIAKLKKAINTCKNSQSKKYSVYATIERPFGNIKCATQKIKAELLKIEKHGLSKHHQKIQISKSIQISVVEQYEPNGQGFLLTGITDLDAANNSDDSLLKSINHCLHSKKEKVKTYLNSYKEWWLVLSDTITYNSIDEYKDFLEKNVSKHPFSRIVFINPIDGAFVSEI